ncbi:hypothetical protein RJT34_23045 [Clitoria ternatea]|uniref:Uncharacterized protein n=1 Tax=Clitoria ternatea TaxID=43366 RepID=A0AAN9FKF8_CLITE
MHNSKRIQRTNIVLSGGKQIVKAQFGFKKECKHETKVTIIQEAPKLGQLGLRELKNSTIRSWVNHLGYGV